VKEHHHVSTLLRALVEAEQKGMHDLDTEIERANGTRLELARQIRDLEKQTQGHVERIRILLRAREKVIVDGSTSPN
jgi:FtsZ-binding cell division protein ZapB